MLSFALFCCADLPEWINISKHKDSDSPLHAEHVYLSQLVCRTSHLFNNIFNGDDPHRVTLPQVTPRSSCCSLIPNPSTSGTTASRTICAQQLLLLLLLLRQRWPGLRFDVYHVVAGFDNTGFDPRQTLLLLLLLC
jgi:hypothetical protein